MSEFNMQNGVEIQADSIPEDDYVPAWVREMEEENGLSFFQGMPENFEDEDVANLQMEQEAALDSDSEEETWEYEELDNDTIPIYHDVSWDGDHEQFLPETPDFDEPLSFISDSRINATTTPFQLLRAFLTDEVIGIILQETNRYAVQKSISKWKNLTAEEFWRFLGLNFLFGIIRKPSFKDYWSTNNLMLTPSFGRIMTRDRFLQILRGIHFFNLQDIQVNRNDRLHKLGTIFPIILRNFRRLVNPGEFLTLDEELMPFKGRLSFRQYNAKKRGRFGVESFFLMDSEKKYVLDILPYQGRTTPIHDPSWITNFGFGGAVVLSLLRKGFFGKNHRLVVDNYFHSPRLAKALLEKQIFVLGTVRKNRRFLPSFRNLITGRQDKMRTGEVETFSDGDLLLERWGDRREVLMLNSFVPHRMEDCESRNPANQRLKPASVLIYNKTMGALDDMDAIIRPYQALRKTKKWYRKFAFHIFDICVYNSFVVASHFSSDIHKKGYKFFLLKLIEEIFSSNPIPRSQRGRPLTQQQNYSRAHFPEIIRDSSGKKKRSNCQLCTKRKVRKATPFKCTVCGIWLCVGPRDSCFAKHHKFSSV